VIKPGTRPTFRSQAVIAYDAAQTEEITTSLGCLTYRTIEDANSVDVTLTRYSTYIKVENGMTATDIHGTSSTNFDTSSSVSNNATLTNIKNTPLFQDAVLPTRLMILLQGAGGGGSGGNKG
jgi:hypothetical protein